MRVTPELDNLKTFKVSARQDAYRWPLNKRWAGYVFAFLVVVAATLLRLAMLPITGAGAPYVLFFGAVLTTAYSYGRGPGLLAAFLAGATAPFTVTNVAAFLPYQILSQSLMFLLESSWVVFLTDAFVSHKRANERRSTALAKSREILRQSEEHYRVLTEVSPQVTWEATLQGEITYLNTWWSRFTGLSREESKGWGWLDAVPSEERKDVSAEMIKQMTHLRAVELELPLKRGIDGQRRIHLMRGQPVTSRTGAILKWVGVATDIQDQKSTLAQLATAVSARDNFLSMASHELKTPLTSMQLMTQMMRRSHDKGRADAFEPSKVIRLIAQTDKSVQRLTRIIDDMLDVSRIARGRMAFRFEYFDLKDMVKDVIERMREQLVSNHIEVRLVCDSQLLGYWDRFRIEQVLTNLLTNAIRYGQGSPIDVTLEAEADGSARLSVRDFGPGVAREDRERIFEQFERASTHQALGGLGLGLFICREIVERHGGHIDLSSAEEELGANFVVHLPLKEAPPPQQNTTLLSQEEWN